MFQNGQLAGQGIVGGAAGGEVLHADGQAVAGIGTGKGGGHGAGIAPGFEDLVHQTALNHATGRGGEVGQQLRQSRRQGGGFAQAADLSRALHVRQAGDGAGVQRVGKLAVEGVLHQIDVAQVAADFAQSSAAAVGFDEAAQVGQLVAVGQDLAVFAAAGVDGGDILAAQREQFVGLADAVLVQVAPQAQVGELGIAGIDFAVEVGIQVAQGVEAVGGQLAVAFDHGIAEQFATIVDFAVSVFVQHQEGVVGSDPAGRGLDAIGVELDGGGGVDAEGFQAVVVQV